MEEVSIFAPDMLVAMQAFLGILPEHQANMYNFDPEHVISVPYMFWYYIRDNVVSALERLPTSHRIPMELFRDWIEASYGAEWSYVDSRFAKGVFSPMTMKYLVQHGDVLISSNGSSVSSYMSQDGMSLTTPEDRLDGRVKPGATSEKAVAEHLAVPPRKDEYEWCIKSWTWSYDGRFKKTRKRLSMRLKVPSPHAEVPITSLNFFPFRFEDDKLRGELKRRGQTFWSCRKRKLVSYAHGSGQEMSVWAKNEWPPDTQRHNDGAAAGSVPRPEPVL
ncbi:hypothetical protein PspLS_10882 [Pyricularia sp. CBS 133598]|nr:hypothetical protein PspLS_10882 [Pyricularia sp. CBS 133598]